jgi:hypothetical protein
MFVPTISTDAKHLRLLANSLDQSLNLVSCLVNGAYDGDPGRSRFRRCMIPQFSWLVDGYVIPNDRGAVTFSE